MYKNLSAVILAAGEGKRMKSSLPKVLHKVQKVTLLDRILGVIAEIEIQNINLVINKNMIDIANIYNRPSLNICIQEKSKGTAAALGACAVCYIDIAFPKYAKGSLLKGIPIQAGYVLILLGDSPFLDSVLLKDFINKSFQKGFRLNLIGVEQKDPTGYGRLVFKNQSLSKIVEEKEADSDIKKINLCNSGVFLCEINWLFQALQSIPHNEESKEYYLTSLIEIANQMNENIYVYETNKAQSFLNINDQQELQYANNLHINHKG